MRITNKEEKEMDGNNIDNIITEIFSASARDTYQRFKLPDAFPLSWINRNPHTVKLCRNYYEMENDWRTDDL